MIDIWGRPILAAGRKEPTETPATDEIKKLIEDEIAETLNLTSVDPGEIVVFQDRQGKLKSGDVSLNDVLTRHRDKVAEDTMVLYTSDGKLKPGELVSTITNSVTTIQRGLDTQVKFIRDIQGVITGFFGDPRATAPNLATIKDEISAVAGLRLEYDAHITQFSALRRNFNRTDDAVSKFFNKKNVKPEDVKTTIDDIKTEIGDINDHIFNQKRANFNELILRFFKDTLSTEDNVTIDSGLIINRYTDIDKHIGYQQRFNFNELIFKLFENTSLPGSNVTIGSEFVTNSYHQINLYIKEQERLNVNKLILRFFKDTRYPSYNNTMNPESVTNRYHEIDQHIKDQTRLKVNEVIPAFFGNPAVISPTLAEIKTFIDKINRLIQDIQNQLLYLKITHSSIEHIKNISYVVDKGILDWIKNDKTYIFIRHYGIAGLYRLSWVSIKQFNIIRGDDIFDSSPAILILGDRDNSRQISFSAVKDEIVRARIAWCLEFVSPLTSEELAQGFD